MTEPQPRKPLVLDVTQWKVLVMTGVTELGQALQGAQVMDAAGLKWVDDKWASIRGQLMIGWENYSRPVIAAQQQQVANQHQVVSVAAQEPQLSAVEVQANGAAEPLKKRGGWVKGRPRGPRKAKAAVAPPAVTM